MMGMMLAVYGKLPYEIDRCGFWSLRETLTAAAEFNRGKTGNPPRANPDFDLPGGSCELDLSGLMLDG